MTLYRETISGVTHSAKDELDALLADPATAADAAIGYAKVAAKSNSVNTEADVKRGDIAVFKNSDPCVEIVRTVAIAYCADLDAAGCVDRIKILAAVGTGTGVYGLPHWWEPEAASRYRKHRRNPKP